MSEPALPGFFSRFFFAFSAWFRTVFDAKFAASVQKLAAGGLALPEAEKTPKKKEPEAPKKKEPVLKEADSDAALQTLAILQREGRLLDFLGEDVTSFTDAQIGAAARVVHQGCKKAITEHFTIEPVRTEEEGASITVESGFDATKLRVTGNIKGEGPHRGTLSHRGYHVKEVRLPKTSVGHDKNILAPAEVEVA